MELKAVKLIIPEGANIILGQSHFIKTVEDLDEILVGTVPGAKFGLAFSESSGDCLIRAEGNDEQLKAAATRNAGLLARATPSISSCRTPFPSTSSTPSSCARRSAASSAPPPTRWRSSWPRPNRAGASWGWWTENPPRAWRTTPARLAP